MIEKYGILALGILLGFALVALGFSRYQIAKLEGKLALSEQQKEEAINTNTVFAQKLQMQNQEINRISDEAKTNKRKYDELTQRQKPILEKNEERIKVIDRVQVTSDECKSINELIDTDRL